MKKKITDRIPADDLQALEKRISGTILLPGEKKYHNARQIWNGMINRNPALIFQCRHTSDVIEAVHFARDNDLPLSIRGGGHNVSGNALWTCYILVDTQLSHRLCRLKNNK